MAHVTPMSRPADGAARILTEHAWLAELDEPDADQVGGLVALGSEWRGSVDAHHSPAGRAEIDDHSRHEGQLEVGDIITAQKASGAARMCPIPGRRESLSRNATRSCQEVCK